MQLLFDVVTRSRIIIIYIDLVQLQSQQDTESAEICTHYFGVDDTHVTG